MIRSELLLKNMSNERVYEPALARWFEPGETVFVHANGTQAITNPDLDDISGMTADEEAAHTQARLAEITARNAASNDGAQNSQAPAQPEAPAEPNQPEAPKE